MKSILFIVILAFELFAITGCTTTSANRSPVWGALAIDSNQGSAYGFSYDYPTSQEADARALKECGQSCQVVKNFLRGCGAFAADQARGGKASGWGTAATEQEAKNMALKYCRQYGGTQCLVRVWSCNSR
jgi:hypothetical protein